MALFGAIAIRRSAITLSYEATGLDETDRTTYTFSGLAIGAASANRKVLVSIWTRSGVGTPATVSTVTIGGVAATVLKSGPLNTFQNLAFAIADVPTGTTGDVVVTFGSGVTSCAVAVYRLIGATGTVSTEYTDIADPFTVSADIPAGGAAFGIFSPNVADASTMTNLTKDVSGGLVVGDGSYAFASATFAAAQTGLSIGFTQAVTNSAASFITMGPE